ncbi:zinc ion binding [Sporothrix curviconia]|uniref:Zinc ion binding n=1 Tax=Sporothrix curviconia TaxID=1260050 RepID=A0ABP0BEC8_9PEZI
MLDSSFFTDPAILSLLSASVVLLAAQFYTASVFKRQPFPKMKSWVVVKNGAPSVALALKDVGADTTKSLPQPKGADILIRVSHAALNPADLMFMGYIPTWLPFRFRPVPGIDFAGEVVALGPQAGAVASHAAEPLTVGARVAGCLSVSLVATGHGSLVEYLTVPAELVARQPKVFGNSSAEAGPASAGLLGCAGQTAHLAATDPCAEAAFALSEPRVLINGASGAVGSLLVQISKARGARVVGVCSAKNSEFIRRLGADEVIDYTQHASLPTYLASAPAYTGANSFDLVFDCMGDQDLFVKSPAFLTPQGAWLSIVGKGILAPFISARNTMVPAVLGGTPRKYKLMGLSPSGEQARAVAKWATGDERALVKEMPIDSVYPMAEVKEAYEKQATKRARGKIIIKVQEDKLDS